MKTAFNVFRSFVGLGILTLPYAFSQAGTYLAILSLIAITALSWYGVKLYIEVAEDIGYEGAKLQDLVRIAIGKNGGKFAAINIIVIQLAVCIASVVFCGKNRL